MRKSLLVVIISVFLFACSDSENIEDSAKIDIVTGINLVDTSGLPIGVYGNPNTLLKEQTASKTINKKDPLSIDDIDSNTVTVYPTNVNTIFNVVSTMNIKNIWLIKASPVHSFQNVIFNKLLSTKTYDSKEIKSRAFKEFNVQGNSNLQVNVSDFSKGYYRVFVELEGGNIFWENISVGYISESEIDFWSRN